jgi:hypothetical protein
MALASSSVIVMGVMGEGVWQGSLLFSCAKIKQTGDESASSTFVSPHEIDPCVSTAKVRNDEF